MQLKSRNGQIAYVFPHSRRPIAAQARKSFDKLAIWVLALVLVLGALVATITLFAWWDETQTTFSISPRSTPAISG